MYWKARFSRQIYEEAGVYVFENWRYRWLAFDSMTIQTLIHRRHPERIELNYIEAMILPARLKPGPTCVLGLGGAGVMHALSPFYEQQICFAIEHNPAVIRAAHQCFFLDRLKFLSIQHADAYSYLQHQHRKFDHLLVDIFNAKTFPEHCNTLTFIQHCQNSLNAQGVLAVNFADFHAQAKLVDALKQCFAHQLLFITLPRTSNIVALCFSPGNLQPFLTQLRIHKKLRALSWQKNWGYVANL
jgi:spermidine synthase